MNISYEIITKFKFNGKYYIMLLINKYNILYLIYENNKLNIKISKKDLDIFYYIHKSMLIDTKSSLNLGIINWKNNKYEMFYDLNINFFYWFQIVNNYKFKTKKEDNIQLNLALNNMSTVLHENKQSNLEINRKNLFIKRFLNFGKKTICILIASGLCLTTISNAKVLNDVIFKSPKEIMNMKQDFEEQLKTEYYTYRHLHNKDEYNYNNLKECIKNNKNLTEPEKSFISNLKFFFDENHEYMDMRLVESRLSNLKIIYNDNENSNVHGEYNFESNTITIYNAKNFENCKLTTFLHEFMHVCQSYKFESDITLELSNELMTRETLRKMEKLELLPKSLEKKYDKYSIYGSGYSTSMSLEYLLANLLTKEQLKEYQFFPKREILAGFLMEMDKLDKNSISDSEQKKIEERAYRLINGILLTKLYGTDISTYKNFYTQIDYYYSKLNGKSMNVDIKEMFLKYDFTIKNEWDKYYNSKYLDNNYKEYINNYEVLTKLILKKTNMDKNVNIEDIYIIPKTYMSDESKNALIIFKPINKIESKTDYKPIEIEINDKFCEEYSKMVENTRDIDIVN